MLRYKIAYGTSEVHYIEFSFHPEEFTIIQRTWYKANEYKIFDNYVNIVCKWKIKIKSLI